MFAFVKVATEAQNEINPKIKWSRKVDETSNVVYMKAADSKYAIAKQDGGMVLYNPAGRVFGYISVGKGQSAQTYKKAYDMAVQKVVDHFNGLHTKF